VFLIYTFVEWVEKIKKEILIRQLYSL
jgi:hypothetical protein